MNRSKILKLAFKASLPVLAGYIVLGAGFGIMLADKGYGWWWALIMSLTVYAGSMQYVAVDLIGSGAGLISSALVTLTVNFRHLFYGVSMLEKYKDTGIAKPYLIFSLTDETFSLVCDGKVPDGASKTTYYTALSLLNQLYWVIGCTAGGIIGNTFKFNTAGIDFSMTVLFISIFVDQWDKNRNHLPALIGVVVSLICLLIFKTSNFLIPSLIIICMLLFVFRGKIEGAKI